MGKAGIVFESLLKKSKGKVWASIRERAREG